MIRTHILRCELGKEFADSLNRESGRIYTQVLVTHWRTYRHNRHWLSQYGAMRLNDWLNPIKTLHAHTIDAAQEGFYKACTVTRAARRVGINIRFPYHPRRFRTTIWKKLALKIDGSILIISNGKGSSKIKIHLPNTFLVCLRILEVRLVYDKASSCYNWHIVAEDGKSSKSVPGDGVVSVDLGEIHPAVVGDENESIIITCRELRHKKQGHHKRLGSIAQVLSRKKKGSRRHKRLVHARSRMNGKHKRVVRDMQHKISRAIVEVATEKKAGTIVVGDVRNVADSVDLGKKVNQKISSWDHGKIRSYVGYKAQAEGIKVMLQAEHYTSQTCPRCGYRHKPRGRVFKCPSCAFQSHRDVVGQINILSVFKHGVLGHIQVPAVIKHRIPHNLRVMRRRQDTGQVVLPSVARRTQLLRETTGL